MNLEQLYWKLPIPLQNIAINIESKKICNRRFSNYFFELLKKIENRNKLDKASLNNYLIKRLKENLIISYENTLYYRDLFKKYDFNPYTFNELEQIKVFPIQQKDEIKNNINIISNNKLREKVLTSYTSGTTGSGLVFPRTIKAENEVYATWWRYWNSNGIHYGTHCGYFGGRLIVPIKQSKPPFWRYLRPANQTIFSIYHMTKDTIKYYLEEFNRKKIPWIHGNPSSLAHFASLLLENDLSFDYAVTFITIGAESLLDHQKEIISRCFGVTPKQHYGLAEANANISECKYGKLHIDEDFSFVELIPYDEDQKFMRLVGTTLVNPAFFLLRYDTNDLVKISDNQSCKCGSTGRVVDEIVGRADDLIKLKDGRMVGRLPQLFKDMVNVKEAQIRQDVNGDITFYVVKNSYYSQKDEDKLHFNVKNRLNINDYSIKYVNQIKKTRRGKLKYVISEYKD